MFKLKLDEEINLVFLDVSLAKLYLKLRNENLNYLSQFLSWPTIIDNEESMQKWIQDRLIDYARGTKLFLAIEYKKDIIEITGFNNINLTLRKLELAYWIAENINEKVL